MIRDKVLLVDDEPRVLSALSRDLFELDLETILTAPSADMAMEQLQANPDTAVIVSDYRMPGMNGVDFLTRCQQISPDASRIMLTGFADLQMAVDSVNQANIFRFLLKPCKPNILVATIQAGFRQHQLVISERELLSKTLNGSVKVLVDILSALSPELFARTNNLRYLGRSLGQALQLENIWDVELAVLLCRLGAVTVPKEILDKWIRKTPLDSEEQAIIAAIPETGSMLLNNIPRLEKISESIRWYDCSFTRKPGTDDCLAGEQLPIISRILKILTDYDWAYYRTYNQADAFKTLVKQRTEYDPQILEIFGKRVLAETDLPFHSQLSKAENIAYISVFEIKPGMMLAKDVVDPANRLIIGANTWISEPLRYRLINYYRLRLIKEPIPIYKDTIREVVG
jgi:response regulator RpfG family c-di-GMP phosphodiesterase